jgi:hypothetical protein
MLSAPLINWRSSINSSLNTPVVDITFLPGRRPGSP